MSKRKPRLIVKLLVAAVALVLALGLGEVLLRAPTDRLLPHPAHSQAPVQLQSVCP